MTTDLKTILKLVAVAFGLYGLSFLGYIFPAMNWILFWLILLCVVVLTLKKFELGVFAVFFELFIGVKGYLFSFDFFGFVMSLRLAIFIAVFLIWIYKILVKKEEVNFAKTKIFPFYAIFSTILALGMITAVLYGNNIKNMFFDANGYFFLAFAFPLFTVIWSKKNLKNLIFLTMAGGIAISFFSLFVSLEFTLLHQDSRPDLAEAVSSELTLEEGSEEEILEKISHSITAKDELKNFNLVRNFLNQKPQIYRWTKDTGIAEISYLAGPFFRVFSPGQIYSLVSFTILLTIIFTKSLKVKNNPLFNLLPRFKKPALYGLAGLTLLIIVMGFSRSLWLGLLASCLYLLFSIPYKKSLKIIFCGLVVLIVLVIVLRLFAFGAFLLIEERATSIINPSSESSGSNRVNMLPPIMERIYQHLIFGSGFGATIEYESIVPEKYGTLRVFAFEWAYLDTVMEIGVVGLVAYLFLIFKIFKRLSLKDCIFFLAIIIALAVVNVTTPYLNHPLGIGVLLLGMVLSEVKVQKVKVENSIQKSKVKNES